MYIYILYLHLIISRYIMTIHVIAFKYEFQRTAITRQTCMRLVSERCRKMSEKGVFRTRPYGPGPAVSETGTKNVRKTPPLFGHGPFLTQFGPCST